MWPPVTGFTGLQFVSASQGWAVGGRVILHTADGGQSWTTQDHGKLGLTGVDFIDARHGWAAGADRLLATSDGGAHWTSLPEPCPLIRSMHFVSPSLGFAVAGGTMLGEYSGVLAPHLSGIALRTSDGGRRWQRLATPGDAQSICFTNTSDGWLGADGHLYRTANGGASWAMVAPGPRPPSGGGTSTMIVQCAGTNSAWAVDIGGAALGHQAQVGYHAGPSGADPIFAEQYIPHPGVRVSTESPASYGGPVSALSATEAVFVGWCPACGYGVGLLDLASRSGSVLQQESKIGGLGQPTAASFLSPEVGWVAGAVYPGHENVIVGTGDGGRSWRTLYRAGG
jgi:hypothetical protein